MAGDAVLRWARALTLAAVMLAGGLTGHVATGGLAPAASVLLPVLVITAAAIAPLLGVPASTRRVSALLLTGQGLLHVVLQMLGGSTADTAGHPTLIPAAAGGAFAEHLGAHGAAPAPAGGWMPLLSGAHLGMLAAHVVAALVVGVWLAAGERAAWTLVAVATLPVVDAWITLRELARTDVVAWSVVPGPIALPRWRQERAVLHPIWAGRGVSRRGPPRLSAA